MGQPVGMTSMPGSPVMIHSTGQMPQVGQVQQRPGTFVNHSGQLQLGQQSAIPQALKVPGSTPGMTAIAPAGIPKTREQVLEQRVRELELIVMQKEDTIKELHDALAKTPGGVAALKKVRPSDRRSGSGFRKVGESKPAQAYSAVDQEDNIDVRLEEFYNSTASVIKFRRINRGFYRFGDTIVEMDIINHKLMARTEDGWNRGKFGPIEKFMMYYENVEREKAGIASDA